MRTSCGPSCVISVTVDPRNSSLIQLPRSNILSLKVFQNPLLLISSPNSENQVVTLAIDSSRSSTNTLKSSLLSQAVETVIHLVIDPSFPNNPKILFFTEVINDVPSPPKPFGPGLIKSLTTSPNPESASNNPPSSIAKS